MTVIPHAIPRKSLIRSSTGLRRRKAVNAFMLALTGVMTLLALVPLFWIITYVVLQGGRNLDLAFFTRLPRPLGLPGGGVLHAIEGTLLLSILASFFSVPPGLLAALYVARHPNTPLGTAVRFATDVLSGVPSIVIGLFGYAVIVKTQGHYSAIAGGIVLAMIMLPMIIRTTEEMVKLVPGSLREGSLALGAPEWKTSLSVILPAASNGIITGVLLGLARATGETAPLLFTTLGNERFEIGAMIQRGVNAGLPFTAIVGQILNQPVDSLPLTLWKYSQQPYPERVSQAWTAALVLMLFVLIMNITARVIVQMRTARMRG